MREREKNRVRLRDPAKSHFRNDQREHYNYYKGSTSFFFTNFPDSHGQEEMWKVFLRWGRVIDVFIPSKKDKFGKRFGFVRFLDVQQPKVLEDKLDSLWIGSYKLRVNIPAFVRGDAQNKVHTIQKANGAVNRGGTKVAGWSYADATGGGGKQSPLRGNTVATTNQFIKRATNRTNRWSGLEFEVSEEEMAWLKDCYVGKLSDPEGIQTLKQRFELEELLSVSLIPMGGNLVLIKALQGEMLEEKVMQNDKQFSRWFLEVRPWDPEMVARERSVWVKISGVPVHCWNENFFSQTALLVGSSITIDDSTRDKVRLDYGRALVKTASPDPIDKIVEVKINDVLFSIRIREEVFCDNPSRYLTDWKYQNPDLLSSDEEDSMANSILAVPESNLNDEVGMEDVQRLLSEFSNSNFGRNATFEDGGRGTRCKGAGSRVAEEYDQPAKTLPNVCTARLCGEDYISNSLSVDQRAGVISVSPTQEMEDLGHGSIRPNLPGKTPVGCAGPQHETEMFNQGRGECSKGVATVSQEKEGPIGPEFGILVNGLEEIHIHLSMGSTGDLAGVKEGLVEEGIGTKVGKPEDFNREGKSLFVKSVFFGRDQ